MILLDTHIWVWWVAGGDGLTDTELAVIQALRMPGEERGVSVMSCWEVGMLASKGRLPLPLPVDQWVTQALGPSGVTRVPLTPAIAVASASLPAPFHADPADRIIVATAGVLDIPLVTRDGKIRQYPHVKVLL